VVLVVVVVQNGIVRTGRGWVGGWGWRGGRGGEPLPPTYPPWRQGYFITILPSSSTQQRHIMHRQPKCTSRTDPALNLLLESLQHGLLCIQRVRTVKQPSA